MSRLHAKDLTLDEKLMLLMGAGTWETHTLGGKLYESKVTDGPHGMRRCVPDGKGGFDEVASVAYPSSEVLAQTWRPSLAYDTAASIADCLIETETDTLLAPGVNIKRNPLCGRNFEYFSEDPLVSGVFGREFIRGIQSRGCGATLKHFCCNNAEYSRFFMSSEVDERTLREIYLEPFRIAAEAKPWATMCAYNPVNGIRMSEHKKLYDILRNEFGFDGIMMSDWGAVQGRAASAKAGLDLEMPAFGKSLEYFKKDLEAGVCTEADIDACVERMLDYVYLCEETSKTRGEARPLEVRLAAARKVAEEGIVLLKNNGVLPLAPDATVSVTGECAAKYMQGGGSSRIVPSSEPPTVADALRAVLPEGKVTYQPSRDYCDTYPRGIILHKAINVAYENDVAIVCVGRSDSEGHDRENMRLPLTQEKFIIDTAKQNPNTVVVLFCGAAMDMSAWIDDVAAVIYAGYPGEMGTRALADILVGKVNPSGRLSESFPLTDKDAPTYGQYYDAQRCLYSEGLLVGYRWFDTAPLMGKQADLLFPFGYGLTYSTFTYDKLEVAENGDGVEVSFDITNVSEVDGSEVAQVYVHEVHPTVFRPYKELKAFEKVDIKAGETVRVTLPLDRRAFAFYSTAIDDWMVNPGHFEILVGPNAVDIELGTSVEIR